MPKIHLCSTIVGLLLIAACASSPGGLTTEPPAEPTAEVVGEGTPEVEPTAEVAIEDTPEVEAPTEASSGGSGACANPYYPVIEGATWTYTVTGGLFGPFSYTDMVTAVGAGGFTLTSEFPELTRTQEWACGPEGLAGLEYGASISAPETSAQFETTSTSGVTLPASIAAGDEWTQSFEIQGEQVLPNGETATSQGTVTFASQAAGVEEVTVPAGTFQAMRVDSTVTFDLTAQVGDVSAPVSLESTSSSWFAPEIGLVKTVGTDTMFSEGATVTLELVSYSIP